MTSSSLRLPGVVMTADDYVAINFRLWQRRPRTRFNHWLLGAALLLLSASVGLDIAQTGRVTNLSSAVFLVVGVLYGLFRLKLVRYQLRRAYAKNPVAQEAVDFVLNADRLCGNSTSGRFEVRWKLIWRAVHVGDWLLLYPTDAACYYLDLRQRQAPATTEEVFALLSNNSVSVQVV